MIMKFEKGKQYECLQWRQEDLFTIGKIYECPKKGKLIDNDGDPLFMKGYERLFKLHEPEPKLGDKVLVWDEDESKSEELIFLAKSEGVFPYVAFSSPCDYERYKTGHSFGCESYKNMKPLPQVETETDSDLVSFGNFLLADRGEGNYLMSKKHVTHADLENWKNEKK